MGEIVGRELKRWSETLEELNEDDILLPICVNLIYMKRTDTYWERT